MGFLPRMMVCVTICRLHVPDSLGWYGVLPRDMLDAFIFVICATALAL